MTLTELQTEVYEITNRPDLVSRTLSAIRSATLKLHQADYFYKDLFETGIAFPSEDYLQQFQYRTIIPQWRALSYLRWTDANYYDQGDLFEVITPQSIVDDYATNRTNVVYVAGEVIQLRSEQPIQYAILGCYLNPIITASGYSSWIATDHPFAIIYNAAAQVFKSIGKDQEWQAWTLLAQEQLQELRVSNIEARGM